MERVQKDIARNVQAGIVEALTSGDAAGGFPAATTWRRRGRSNAAGPVLVVFGKPARRPDSDPDDADDLRTSKGIAMAVWLSAVLWMVLLAVARAVL